MERVSLFDLMKLLKAGDREKILSLPEKSFGFYLGEIVNYNGRRLPVALHLIQIGYRFKNKKNLSLDIGYGNTLAHMMVRHGHFFDPDKDRDVLLYRGVNGRTVAHEMAEMGYRFDPERHKYLLYLSDNIGVTVAHLMASNGYFFDPETYPDIVRLSSKYNWTVAHYMAEKGFFFDPDKYPDIVRLTHKTGVSVADLMAENGYMFDPEKHGDIVKCRGVAFAMAKNGFFFDPDKYPDIVKLRNDNGRSVAHEMASKGYRFDPEKHREIIALASKTGWTVAHEMSSAGYDFDPERFPDILKLKTKTGWTVAHEMAGRGYRFNPEHIDILSLKDKEGMSVGYLSTKVLTENFEKLDGLWFDPDEHVDVLMLTGKNGNTIAHELASAGYIFSPDRHKKILRIKNRLTGYTVAYEMAHQLLMELMRWDGKENRQKYEKTRKRIKIINDTLYELSKESGLLETRDDFGYSLAHLMAGRGRFFDDEGRPIFHPVKQKRILLLVNEEGDTVLQYLLKHSNSRIEKEEQFFIQNPEILHGYIKLIEEVGLKNSRVYGYLVRLSMQQELTDIGIKL